MLSICILYTLSIMLRIGLYDYDFSDTTGDGPFVSLLCYCYAKISMTIVMLDSAPLA